MPDNNVYISLILKAVPFAKLIFCQRDPLDNCLSIYFERYNINNQYSYDLKNLASYYAEYQNLMAHWIAFYGERILVVRYEELVRNPETTALRLYRHCGLDFDPAALRHAFTIDQIGHWKHYEPHLAPLHESLARHAAPQTDALTPSTAQPLSSPS